MGTYSLRTHQKLCLMSSIAVTALRRDGQPYYDHILNFYD